MVHQYTDEEIRDRVEIALRILFKNDLFLLKKDAHEVSISHKLAEYLQILFPDWHVDLEYNRFGNKPKKINDEKIRPDIIIHKRGKDNNLLVIEIKKSNNDENGDTTKLEKLTSLHDYKYKLGLFIRFDKTKTTLKWFKDGWEACYNLLEHFI